MRFIQWDPVKARTNLMKHGVSFEEAASVFDDPEIMLLEDERHLAIERRVRAQSYVWSTRIGGQKIMKKKYIEFSAEELRAKRKGKATSRKYPSDKEIDFSDIPELMDEQLKKLKRPGRPLLGDSPRVPITIRIEKDVLDRLKKEAKKRSEKYQSLINSILKKAV